MQCKYITLLIALISIYLLVGAVIFQALERPEEKGQCDYVQRKILNISERLKNGSLIADETADLLQVAQFAAAYGIEITKDLNVTCVVKWDLEGSFFFCGTVLTTIGYGHISPVTYVGKVVCILYAIVGIPIFLIMFAGLGGKVGKRVTKLGSKIGNRRSWVNKLVVAIIILIPYVIFFLVIPAVVFVTTEGWEYHDAFYYAFITLTTIGFGDFVAGINPNPPSVYVPAYRTMVYVWILLGMAVQATVMGTFTEFWMEAGPGTRESIDLTDLNITESDSGRYNEGHEEEEPQLNDEEKLEDYHL